ncbi:MAG: hypothetical protein KJZ86_27490 [Caldilineaceae bacterium]|nr:hypothetical protein [Caldilineaceae bacterium]HRJ42702.1 hypothetical protein [Caldilineaceae bacterium]
MPTTADTAYAQSTRYVANGGFDKAVLFFVDGSYLQVEHSGIDTRWAKASAQPSMADSVCQAMRLFRLNAKHLQLYFTDGSDAEFFVNS